MDPEAAPVPGDPEAAEAPAGLDEWSEVTEPRAEDRLLPTTPGAATGFSWRWPWWAAAMAAGLLLSAGVAAACVELPGTPWGHAHASARTPTSKARVHSASGAEISRFTMIQPAKNATPAAGHKRRCAHCVELYCFMVMMADGYEPDLVKEQVRRQAGIFKCDSHQVFSTRPLDLGHAVVARRFGGDHSKVGPWGSWMNTENFLLAYDIILKEGRFWDADWTVKVDPDSVFMAARLRTHLKRSFPGGTTSTSVYFKNCHKSIGLLGPLEVFSRSAIDTFGKHREMCRAKFLTDNAGEDGYMKTCMDASGVVAKEDFTQLVDKWCHPGTCASDGEGVAFHPFKDKDKWFHCWDRLLGSA